MTSRREELHKLIDELCDAEERAASIKNDDEAAKAREAAFEKLKPLLSLAGREILRERMGAARLPRLVYQTGARHSKLAIIEGNKPVASTKDEYFADGWTNAHSRQMLMRFLLDMEDILPENLASNAATALWELNSGRAMPLFQPLKYKGMNKPEVNHARHVHLATWYYLQGYMHWTRERALDEMNKNNPDGSRPLKVDTLDKWMRSMKFHELAEYYKDLGFSDMAVGKGMQLPAAVGRYTPFEAETRLNARLKRST